MRTRIPGRFAARFLLAPFAVAQGDRWTVGPLGSADLDTIQRAVNAVADGDQPFVEPGSCPSFVVNDKALTVIASPQAAVDCGTIPVRNLPAGEACEFRGLRATGQDPIGLETRGAYVSTCGGSVWFEDYVLRSNDQPLVADPALEVVG